MGTTVVVSTIMWSFVLLLSKRSMLLSLAEPHVGYVLPSCGCHVALPWHIVTTDSSEAFMKAIGKDYKSHTSKAKVGLITSSIVG